MMEIQFSSFVMLVFLLLSTLILFKLFFNSKNSTTKNLPPGPWKLPLIGNLHNLIGRLPHRGLSELARKYGPLMHLQLGELSVVVVSSPEAAKQVMKTHDVNFASRPPTLAAELVTYNYTNIAFSPYGDYWRQLRKICTMELLSAKRVQSFRSLREEIFSDVMRWVGSKEGSAVDLTVKVYSSTYLVIARAALGKITKERERLLPNIQAIIKNAAGFDIADVYPSIKLFRRMSAGRRLSILHDEVDKSFEEIISEHKLVTNSKSDDKKDLLDVLLGYQDDGTQLPLTNDNIKAVILDILGGGIETGASTVDWAMAEMLKNPKILAKAQKEVRNAFDAKGSYVDESCIHELEYLKAVIKETLRMHPPAPLLLPRKCGQTCEIDGYQIPANTKIIVNAWAINRDSNNWKDADCFQPERFVDNQMDFRGNHFEFIPFGAGRRICPGISFALAGVELLLAMLMYHFDWDLPAGESGQDLDMKERSGATTGRLEHLRIVPTIKRPLPYIVD